MEIRFSKTFLRQFKKIKEVELQKRILRLIKKLENNPSVGKPLTHDLKGLRRLAVGKYRIVYRKEKNTLVINCFEHRKKVYKKAPGG